MSFSEGRTSAGGSTTGEKESAAARQADSLYQNGRRVAGIVDARIDAQAREIHFDEVYQSDNLLIPEDCEFREYRILIQKVSFASRQQAGAADRGRVLKGVTAEILGYLQQ